MIDPFKCDVYSLGMIFFEWITKYKDPKAVEKLHYAKINNSLEEYERLLN